MWSGLESQKSRKLLLLLFQMIHYGSKRLGEIGKRFGNSFLDGVCKSGLDYYLSVLKTSFSVQKNNLKS
jgi:hypothetical protein